MYNSDTGLCTPGSFLKSGTFGAALAPTSTEGDLFAPSVCDTSDGFTYVTSGNASACMWTSTSGRLYQDAQAYCNDLGSHLFVGRSLDKFHLLPYRVHYFIGLNDIAVEGAMTWVDTGEQITQDFKQVFFIPGEPNNEWNEDCVCVNVIQSSHFGNDEKCPSVPLRFVCERPVFVHN